MLSDGVLLSGGGSEIKAWDSLMRFKMLKERVVSLVIVCVMRLFTCRSASCVSGFKMFGFSAAKTVAEGLFPRRIVFGGGLSKKNVC